MKLSTLILTLVFFSAAPVFANHHDHKACKEDRAKFCPEMKMGEGLHKCMKEHKSELSEACQEQMVDMKAAMKDCKADMKSLCGDVKHGEGRKIKCLKEHADKLSEACKAHLN